MEIRLIELKWFIKFELHELRQTSNRHDRPGSFVIEDDPFLCYLYDAMKVPGPHLSEEAIPYADIGPMLF